jgi:hypothetical protein
MQKSFGRIRASIQATTSDATHLGFETNHPTKPDELQGVLSRLRLSHALEQF